MPAVGYADELGYEVRPAEGWVRYGNGRCLDGWYQRLRGAYIATVADLGVGADLSPEECLAAMGGHRRRDLCLAVVVSVVKATVKGGIDKLREHPLWVPFGAGSGVGRAVLPVALRPWGRGRGSRGRRSRTR